MFTGVKRAGCVPVDEETFQLSSVRLSQGEWHGGEDRWGEPALEAVAGAVRQLDPCYPWGRASR